MLEHITKILAIDKLLDYLASGIGATAGPLFRPWQAYMEGHAKRISARADADALAIIAQAQAAARQYLVAPGADVQGAVEITHENIMQRIEFQERKRLANIRSVVESAAEELHDEKVLDIEPDHDWTARFFNCVQDVSSEHMQKLWAKVLSGEVESPGRTSLRTLDALRNISKRDAELFEEIAGYVFGDEIVFYHDGYRHRHRSLSFNNILHLQDCGLINPTPYLTTTINWENTMKHVYTYQTDALMITRDENAGEELRIPAVLLTTAGKELFHVAQCTVQMEYLQDFSMFLQSERCHLSYLKRVNTLPDGRGAYGNPTIIEPRAEQVNGNAL